MPIPGASTAIRKGGQEVVERLGKIATQMGADKQTADYMSRGLKFQLDTKAVSLKELEGLASTKQFTPIQEHISAGTQGIAQGQKNAVVNGVLNPPVKSSKPYQLSEGVEDFMGDIDLQAGRAWQTSGGELDVELKKMLTVGRSKNAKVLSYEELVEKAKTSKTYKTKLDYYHSLVATGPAQSADDTLAYGFTQNPESRINVMKGDSEYSPQLHRSKEFHHKGKKSLQYGIHKRARELRAAGLATDDDILNLHALANSKGIPSGSRVSAAEFMERFGHDIMHKKVTLKKGIQPSGTVDSIGGYRTKPKNLPDKVWIPAKKAADDVGETLTPFDIDYIKRRMKQEPLEKAIARWKLFRKTQMYQALAPDGQSEITRMLKRTDNMSIAELTQFQKEVLDDISVPMQEEAVLMEEVMERLTPKEQFDLMNMKDSDVVMQMRRALKDKKSAIAEHKADTKIEDAMEAAYDK